MWNDFRSSVSDTAECLPSSQSLASARADALVSQYGNNTRKRSMARPVDYRIGRGSKGVHTEDEQVPRGKKDQGGQSPPFDQGGASQNARARSAGEGKHKAGHEGEKSARKKSK